MCTGWKAEDVVRKHTNNIVILKDIMMHVLYEEELSFAVMERITKREETTSIFYHRLKIENGLWLKQEMTVKVVDEEFSLC